MGGTGARTGRWNDDRLLALLLEAADAVRVALRDEPVFGLSGLRDGQYRADLVADRAVWSVLNRGGVGVLSEETGLQYPQREIVVIVDPIDGSTNADRGVPWFACSLCAVDAEGARAALVLDLASGHRFEAVRGGGATMDGRPIGPSGCLALPDAIVGLSGLPPRHLGWAQFRSLGAMALDLCAVASGTLDAVIDCSPDAHGVWDYAAGLLICAESGAMVGEALDRELLVLDPAARRTPVAACGPDLYAEVLAARKTW